MIGFGFALLLIVAYFLGQHIGYARGYAKAERDLSPRPEQKNSK